MKLYRIVVITPTANVERGVWADSLDMKEGLLLFYNDEMEVIQSYPSQITYITNIETQEEYDARKAK